MLTIVVISWARINPFPLSIFASVELVALSVALCYVDIARRRERVFIGNLGLHPLALGPLFVGPAILGEAALRVLGSAVL